MQKCVGGGLQTADSELSDRAFAHTGKTYQVPWAASISKASSQGEAVLNIWKTLASSTRTAKWKEERREGQSRGRGEGGRERGEKKKEKKRLWEMGRV